MSIEEVAFRTWSWYGHGPGWRNAQESISSSTPFGTLKKKRRRLIDFGGKIERGLRRLIAIQQSKQKCDIVLYFRPSIFMKKICDLIIEQFCVKTYILASCLL
jgi:hypothetical protein